MFARLLLLFIGIPVIELFLFLLIGSKIGIAPTPHEAVLDGLMILIAGAVLLTPGFLTDAIGFSLLGPSIRAAVRGVLATYLKGKITIAGQNMGAPNASRNQQGTINIDAEVIDITPTSTSSSNDQSP